MISDADMLSDDDGANSRERELALVLAQTVRGVLGGEVTLDKLIPAIRIAVVRVQKLANFRGRAKKRIVILAIRSLIADSGVSTHGDMIGVLCASAIDELVDVGKVGLRINDAYDDGCSVECTYDFCRNTIARASRTV